MTRFFVAPDEVDSWRKGLAKPDHWRPGYSAHSLAHTWHPRDDFPASVRAALDQEPTGELAQLELVVGIPEYKVPLPGGDAASQTDLLVLARSQSGKTIVIAVEGKAREPFGDKTIGDWLIGASIGKRERLAYLLRILGIRDGTAIDDLRYQLLHRAASPVIEAARLDADHAVMLVHSFGGENRGFEDFRRFAQLLGAEVSVGSVRRASTPRSLFLGWITDPHPES